MAGRVEASPSFSSPDEKTVYYAFVGINNTPQGRNTRWRNGKKIVTLPTNFFLDSPLVKRTLDGRYIPTTATRKAMNLFCPQVKPNGPKFQVEELPIAHRNTQIKNSQRCPEWFGFGFCWGYDISAAVTDQQAIAAMKVDPKFFPFWPALRAQVPGLPYYSWKHIGDKAYTPWLIFMRDCYLRQDPPPLEDPYYREAGLTDYRGYHARYEEIFARLKGYGRHVGDVVRNETGVIDFQKDTVYVGVREQPGVLLLPQATVVIKTAPKLVLVEASRWSDSQMLFVLQMRYPPGKLAHLPPIGLEGDPAMHTFIPENDCGFSGFRYFHAKGETDSVQWPPSSPQAFLRNAILGNRQGEIPLSSLNRNPTILCFNFEILMAVQKHLGVTEPVKGDMVVVHGKMLQGTLTRHPESFQVGNTKNLSLPSVATHLNLCLFSTYAGGKVDNLVLAFPKDIDRQLVVPFIQFGNKVRCITF